MICRLNEQTEHGTAGNEPTRHRCSATSIYVVFFSCLLTQFTHTHAITPGCYLIHISWLCEKGLQGPLRCDLSRKLDYYYVDQGGDRNN